MTSLNQIWKCEICGNIVQVLHKGADSLVCCGQPMKLQIAKSKEQEGNEKHVPVIEENKVKVGSVPHPMEAEHYIEWIAAVSEKGEISRVFLKPSQELQAEFCFKPSSAKAYCNVHGLWKG